jgi:glyoxylate reductase
LAHRIAGAEGVICALTDRIDAPLLDGAPSLKVVANWAVGFDNIDVPACTQRRIPVGNTPDVLTETTADLAFGLILAVARRIPEGDRFVRDGMWGAWDPNLLLGTDVWGATLGIVGMGRIGQAIAARAAGFRMKVCYWSRSRLAEDAEADLGYEWCGSLDELLGRADFVSLSTSLSSDTRHLIGDREFGLMKPTAFLINTGRGGLVDQQALSRAIATGRIAGAGLDVTDPEPMPAGDPLLQLPGVVVVPHIGSASTRTRIRMADLAVENALAGLEGRRLPHCVNPEVYREP